MQEAADAKAEAEAKKLAAQVAYDTLADAKRYADWQFFYTPAQ